MKAVFATLFIVSLSVVSPAANHGKGAEDVPKDTTITLERTVCFGTCPSYALTVSADGAVVFEGREYVKKSGVSKGQLSQAQVRQLITEFEKAGYFSLKDRYVEAKDGCTRWATDHPSAITSIRINGKRKRIEHYYGCTGPEATETLTELEKRIDEIVNTAQWVK